MVTYSDQDKLTEIERELAMRKRYYPSMIAKGSLSELTAQRHIAVMQAVAEDYRERLRSTAA